MSNKQKRILEFSKKMTNSGVLESPTIKHISERLNLSPKQTAIKIKEMYDSGFGKISVALNYNKLPLTMAEIAIKSSNPAHHDYIFDFLKNTKYVEDIVKVSSQEITFVVSVKVPSLESLNEVNLEIMNGLSDKYAKIVTMIITNYIYDEETLFETKTNTVELDKMDWKIISLLKINAMMTLREMSEKTGLREPTIHRRIKLLKDKGIILGYICSRNWENIPHKLASMCSLLFVRLTLGRAIEKEFIKNILESKNAKLSFAFLYLGAWDVMMGVKTEDIVALDMFIDEEVSKKEYILDVKVCPILEAEVRDVFADFAE
ncbi:MAG: Lrp/AsnC family transcriptional regulator [Candidatus Diapherotrites archaeon]